MNSVKISKQQELNSIKIYGKLREIITFHLRFAHGCLMEVTKRNGVTVAKENAHIRDLTQEVAMELFVQGFNFYDDESLKVATTLRNNLRKIYGKVGDNKGYLDKVFGQDVGKFARVISDQIDTFMRDRRFGNRGRFRSPKEIPCSPEMLDSLVSEGIVWRFGRDKDK